MRPLLSSNCSAHKSSHLTNGLAPRSAPSLRDFPLHINQISALDLDPIPIAAALAETLAILHWDLHLDAAGVKFLLGGSLAKEADLQPLSATMLSKLPPGFSTRQAVVEPAKKMGLWLVDFDEVGSIAIGENAAVNDKAVERIVESFMRSNHFPRPLKVGPEEQRVWEAFEKGYVGTSARLRTVKEMAGEKVKCRGLPEKFVKRVCARQAELLKEDSDEGGDVAVSGDEEV